MGLNDDEQPMLLIRFEICQDEQPVSPAVKRESISKTSSGGQQQSQTTKTSKVTQNGVTNTTTTVTTTTTTTMTRNGMQQS